jgi:hypothetical protein
MAPLMAQETLAVSSVTDTAASWQPVRKLSRRFSQIAGVAATGRDAKAWVVQRQIAVRALTE